MHTTITTPNAPAALGPYSQAIFCNDTMYLAGQIPMNPVTLEIIGIDIQTQTKQVFENIIAVLGTKDMTLDNVVRCEVYLTDIEDFAQMNKIYAEYFGDHKPARTTVEISKLPKNSKIEITATAILF